MQKSSRRCRQQATQTHPKTSFPRLLTKCFSVDQNYMTKHLSAFSLLLCFTFSLTWVSFAQSSLQHRDNPSAAYILGPGDQILIQVTDLDDFPNRPLQIDPDGDVDLPLVGPFHASGLTLAQMKVDLAARLSKYISSPRIVLNLIQNQSTPVSVVGSVNTPGVHQLDGPKRLLEVISLSGGLRPDAGNEVIVTRQAGRTPLTMATGHVELSGGYSTGRYSLDDLINARNPADNILVEPGDVVSIPKAELIYVVGDVRKAGGFTLSSHPSLPLLQALSLAEGMGPHAAGKRARILRPAPGGDGTPKEIVVDVDKIMAGKAPNPQLFANDVLFIPNSAVKAVSERAFETALGVVAGVAIYRQ